jgi:hypothetical protein
VHPLRSLCVGLPEFSGVLEPANNLIQTSRSF